MTRARRARGLQAEATKTPPPSATHARQVCPDEWRGEATGEKAGQPPGRCLKSSTDDGSAVTTVSLQLCSRAQGSGGATRLRLPRLQQPRSGCATRACLRVTPLPRALLPWRRALLNPRAGTTTSGAGATSANDCSTSECHAPEVWVVLDPAAHAPHGPRQTKVLHPQLCLLWLSTWAHGPGCMRCRTRFLPGHLHPGKSPQRRCCCR